MRKIFAITLVMLFAIASFGYCAERLNYGGTDIDPLLKRVIPYDYIQIGAERGGVSTMVSASTAIPTGYSVVLKQIGSAAPLTMVDGTPGQVETIIISSNATGATAVLTPTTKTGFTTISFNAALDSVTLLFLDTTYGWIVIGQNSVTIA